MKEKKNLGNISCIPAVKLRVELLTVELDSCKAIKWIANNDNSTRFLPNELIFYRDLIRSLLTIKTQWMTRDVNGVSNYLAQYS